MIDISERETECKGCMRNMGIVKLVLTKDEAETLVGVLENETREEDYADLKEYINKKISMC